MEKNALSNKENAVREKQKSRQGTEVQATKWRVGRCGRDSPGGKSQKSFAATLRSLDFNPRTIGNCSRLSRREVALQAAHFRNFTPDLVRRLDGGDAGGESVSFCPST